MALSCMIINLRSRQQNVKLFLREPLRQFPGGAEYKPVASQIVHDGTQTYGNQVGQGVIHSHYSDEEPHQYQVSQEREHAVRQMKVYEPAEPEMPAGVCAVCPCPVFMPQEVVLCWQSFGIC